MAMSQYHVPKQIMEVVKKRYDEVATINTQSTPTPAHLIIANLLVHWQRRRRHCPQPPYELT